MRNPFNLINSTHQIVQTAETGNMSGSSHGRRDRIFEHCSSYIRLLRNIHTDLYHPWYPCYQVSILGCLSVFFSFVKTAKPIGPKLCTAKLIKFYRKIVDNYF